MPERAAAERVLFVHDGPLHVGSDGRPRAVYYTVRLVERYRRLAPKVTFAMRVRPPAASVEADAPVLEAPDFEWVAVPDPKSPWRYLRNAKRARSVIEAEVARHDVIVVRLPSTLGYWAFLEARRQRKPVLTEMVACAWDSAWNHSALGKILAPIFFARARWAIARAPFVVYVTDSFLQGRYPSRGRQIGCSDVELEACQERVLAARLERWRSASSEAPITLATLGAVDVRFKNQEAVIQALARLRSGGRQFRYRLAGSGDPARLLQLAERLDVSEQVEVLGMVPHANVAKLLDETDIYVQPSRTEGLPRAVIEAMSRGCPVLGSDAGGTKELIDAECVFPAADEKALATLLQSMNGMRMASLAERNWRAARKFEMHALDEHRSTFYRTFLATIA